MTEQYKLDKGCVIRLSDEVVIPATYDCVDYQEYQAWVSAGNTPLPADPPSSAEIQSALTAAVQAHLDATARTHGYDGILSACTYATDTHPPFQAEGQACVSWRGAVWSTCYTILAEVQAGTRAIPTEAELIALLPVMVWP